jgi:hypothetical protein
MTMLFMASLLFSVYHKGMYSGRPGKALVIHSVFSLPMKYISPTIVNGAV